MLEIKDNNVVEEPVRVAQIMGKLWAGGVETVVFNYYRAIDKSKIQFDFYYDADSTVEPPRDLIEMGAKFIKIPPYQDLFKYLTVLCSYFKNNNYAIVHSHINTLSVFPLLAARMAGIPNRIAHNHSVPGGSEIKRNILKYMLRSFSTLNATSYFACSEKAGRWMFGNSKYEQGKVFIMKNAIDFSKFADRDGTVTRQMRTELGVLDQFVVGHVGRFTYAKNHAFLLDAFLEVLKQKEDSKLLLVGDGELHDAIIDKIMHLGIGNKVIMVGKVSNPEKYYLAMDVLMLPSVYEGLSMTTIEAQAAKRNILISHAVPKEAIISNGCHYMDYAADAKAWADKAIEVAREDIQYTEAKNDYEINDAAETLMKKYLNVLKTK